MKTSVKLLHKKAVIKKNLIDNNKNNLDLLKFLSGKKLVPQPLPGHPGEFKSPENGIASVNIEPGVWQLFDTLFINEYDKDESHYTGLREEKAKYLNGTDAPFYTNVSFAHEKLCEMSLSLAQGQILGIVYPNVKEDINPAPPFIKMDCAALFKKIKLQNPLPYDIIVKAESHVVLPEDFESVFYIDTGNSGITYCGIESHIGTHFSYMNESTPAPNDRIVTSTRRQRLCRILRANGVEDVNEYNNVLHIINSFRLPANMEEFYFSVNWIMKTYTSKDFSIYSENSDLLFGIVSADFRSEHLEEQYPVIPAGGMDPFSISGRGYASKGGAKVDTTLQFYRPI